MPQTPILRDFADRCRRMATSETDNRLKTVFLRMADDYERRLLDSQLAGRQRGRQASRRLSQPRRVQAGEGGP